MDNSQQQEPALQNTTQQALDAALAECERLRSAYDAAHRQAMDNGQARDNALDECERLRADAERLDWIAVNGSFGLDFVTGEVGGNGLTRKAATRTNIDAARAKP